MSQATHSGMIVPMRDSMWPLKKNHTHMKAYYIISYDITDDKGYPEYVEAVANLLPKYGAEVLVSDLNATRIEGEIKDVNAIVVFPSREQALACYHSEEYQQIKKIRMKTTRDGRFVLAVG